MKFWIAMALILPICLLPTFGANKSLNIIEAQPTIEPEIIEIVDEPTEAYVEIVESVEPHKTSSVNATEPAEEEITPSITVEEVVDSIVSNAMDKVVETIPPKPDVVEKPVIEPTVPKATEPIIEETEGEEQDEQKEDDGLVSLGIFRLTAYCSCQKCCGSYALNRPVDENGNQIVYGSIGIRLQAGVSIAVDPSVIPYGTEVVINGHTYVAQDTGGNIVGHIIDVYFDNHQDALNFGTKKAEVFVYE